MHGLFVYVPVAYSKLTRLALLPLSWLILTSGRLSAPNWRSRRMVNHRACRLAIFN
jgi:hypothetical protein